MKKSRFTDEKITFSVKIETGRPTTEIRCEMGISKQTFYRCVWEVWGV